MNLQVIPDAVMEGELGLPFLSTTLAVMAILVVGGCVFLLARLMRGRHEIWVVRCPADGARAVVRLHRAPEGQLDAVVGCSHWRAVGVARCRGACLPTAA